MCVVAGLLVTPWHPVSMNGRDWVFPAGVAARTVRYTGSIYSILLQRDAQADAHALMIGGVWGVTLGHGLVQSMPEDVRGHCFFGDYDLVVNSLARLAQSRNGLVLGGGVRRNGTTGLVDGFLRVDSPSIRSKFACVDLAGG
jgi:hypothetical protein